MASKKNSGGEPAETRMDDLIDRLMLNAVPDRSHAPPLTNSEEVRKYILQLPLWSDEVRGSPNEFLRSALFRPSNRQVRRPFLKDEEIGVIGDGEIRYTGEELRQDDEPAWLQLLHLCRGNPIGAPVAFTPAAFLRSVRRCRDRNPSSRDYQWLSDTITRFTATALVIHSSRLKTKVGLSMVRRFMFQDDDGKRLARWQVWIEPEMANLFGGIYYTQIEWEMRLALPSGLTTWLMGFFASHRKPYAVKVETLMATISRYDLTSERAVRNFKMDLHRALRELVAIGFLKAYEIAEGNLVRVQRGG